MAFTNSMDVDIGDATKASAHDNLADNTEFNREKADVDHDFDITTGDGYHNAAHGTPIHLKNGTDHCIMWLDTTASDVDEWLIRIKSLSGSVPTAASITDGHAINAPEATGTDDPFADDD